jgi:hypothetical protein
LRDTIERVLHDDLGMVVKRVPEVRELLFHIPLMAR